MGNLLLGHKRRDPLTLVLNVFKDRTAFLAAVVVLTVVAGVAAWIPARACRAG
jgi:hypothetical protein